MRKIGTRCYYIYILLIVLSCNQLENTSLVTIKKLDYPSASAIEYYNGKLYVMGDDAVNLLILDTSLNILDSISVIDYPAHRIPKDIKPDFEAATLIADHLLLFGSGSLSPYRNLAWMCNLNELENEGYETNLELLYSKGKMLGVEQINIEGAAYILERLIFVNRGNKSYPYNHLIVTDQVYGLNDSNSKISIIPFEIQKDTASFKGVSGLCYSVQSDKLIMTVSTENTRNNFEDGTIGKSYLWIINNVSGKLDGQSIKPNRRLDLEYIDHRFKGQKIESATIIRETEKLIYLALVADNDDGSSTVFKLNIPKTTSHSE